MSVLRKLWPALKFGTVAGTLGGTVTYLHSVEWDVGSIGLVRFGRAAFVIGKVAVDYKLTLGKLDSNSDEYMNAKSQVHLRSAVKLHDLCCKNGGCFIKVGQHIAALEYLLPSEYVTTLKVLHDDAPQSSLEDLSKVIREDLGHDISEIFTSFDTTPIGAASLAQVHRATLKDGTEVAVKIQHPNLKRHASVDMATMEVLVKGVAWLFPEFQFLWISEETKKNLPLEMDFLHEGANCERVAKIYKDFSFLKVPKIYWDLSTDRVLTMEYCEGGKVTDKQYMEQHKIPVDQVTRCLGKLYSEMIFVEGYVHCDPHPGNVLVNKTSSGDTEIVLLDHGLYQSLSDKFRLDYCELWMSLIKADTEAIKLNAERMGCGEMYPLFACIITARSWDSVTKGIDKAPATASEDQEIQENAGNYLSEITGILNNVPRQLLLILKTNDLLRGIEYALESRADASSFIGMSRCCVRALTQHKLENADNFTSRFGIRVKGQWSLFSLTLYEVAMRVKSSYIWLLLAGLLRRQPSITAS
ncbi:unnamed protein product [Owenia fusiformis]|uniref:Uncharacterized protein n=1 Tax=Owenia fusiformis TaxID=6347 RepID=A0A8J1U154_OWEFU|nr:unnamed protein product [Owenia fusiformis]